MGRERAHRLVVIREAAVFREDVAAEEFGGRDPHELGEAQILGQVKDAYSLAKDLRSTGLVLNQLFEKAFSIAKKVREETGIAERSVSISSAAVEKEEA